MKLVSDNFIWHCFCLLLVFSLDVCVNFVFIRVLHLWFCMYKWFSLRNMTMITILFSFLTIMFTLIGWNNMLLTYKLSFDWCFDYVPSLNYDSIICMIELAEFIYFREDADFVEDLWNEKLVDVLSFFFGLQCIS